MPLKMHPSVVCYSGYYKDTVNYIVFCGEWYIGYIYENGRAPEEMRWFWALHAPSKPGDMRTSNQVATLERAKVEFEASWKHVEGVGRVGGSWFSHRTGSLSSALVSSGCRRSTPGLGDVPDKMSVSSFRRTLTVPSARRPTFMMRPTSAPLILRN